MPCAQSQPRHPHPAQRQRNPRRTRPAPPARPARADRHRPRHRQRRTGARHRHRPPRRARHRYRPKRRSARHRPRKRARAPADQPHLPPGRLARALCRRLCRPHPQQSALHCSQRPAPCRAHPRTTKRADCRRRRLPRPLHHHAASAAEPKTQRLVTHGTRLATR